MNLQEEVDKLTADGYSRDNASARVCQDIILNGIALSGFGKNVTIKGGVVMRNISHNDRRATQDADFDFIKYSISNDSIIEFINKINRKIDVNIIIKEPIIELKHHDYKGKRVFILISDNDGNVLEGKLDIGVHKDLDIKQEEYCFDICFQDDGASILMNSKEQILTEKLKSFLRYGTRSTRYKDIFDICFLSDLVDNDVLIKYMQRYIYEDDSLSVNDINDVYKRISRLFSNKSYILKVDKSGKNWLNMSTQDVFNKNIEFIKSLTKI